MDGLKGKIVGFYHIIPRSVRSFLTTALVFALAWKLAYLCFLINPRVLDRPLTEHVGSSTAYALNHFSGLHGFNAINRLDTNIIEGQMQMTQVSKIIHQGHKVLHIADGCNGLELMVLYVGFIFSFPASTARKVGYILMGLLLIDCLNILRCSLLGFIKEYYHPYFNISHHFIFKAIVYTVIVILWVQFTKTSACYESTS